MPTSISPAPKAPKAPETPETPEHAGPRSPGVTARSVAVSVAVLALIGALLATVFGPDPRPSGQRSGDPDLVSRLEASLGEGRGLSAVSAARIDAGGTAFAGLGDDLGGDGAAPSADTPFELGSITKVFTGHLLADAVARGEMRLDDPLSRHLPELAGSPAGGVTLQQLATHTSGLPRLPAGMVSLRSAFAPVDPYSDWSAQRVIDAARTTGADERGEPGEFEYSNFGMALLGQAQARAGGADSWADLGGERLFTPLGMTATRVVAAGDAEPAGLPTPRWANGRAAQPWTGDGFAPAGTSTRTTARDLARFAQAVLDGSAPGAQATRPVTTTGDGERLGLGWIVSASGSEGGEDGGGSELTWHNGGTGGMRTILALDPAAGRAGLALAVTDSSIDSLGVDLAGDSSTPLRTGPGVLGAVSLMVAGVVLLALLVRLTRPSDRLRLASGVLDGGVATVLLAVAGPWNWLPAWAIGALLGVLVAAAVLSVAAMRGAPAVPAKGRVGAYVSVALSAAIAAATGYVLF